MLGKDEKWQRNVYNNIIATHNLVNIMNVKYDDLEINDTDVYDYLLSYSFPCQDLSLAGNVGKGMNKEDNTRSGLLWEVERILNECKNKNDLPKILLMENVTEVCGMNNLDNFLIWCNSLEKLGYKNYFSNLMATDYGNTTNKK